MAYYFCNDNMYYCLLLFVLYYYRSILSISVRCCKAHSLIKMILWWKNNLIYMKKV